MNYRLKKLKDQVMVITGATSGIGLVTARMAARNGVRLVLAARTEDALRKLTEEITSAGGQAEYVVADVGKEAQMQLVADRAIERFGGFDTWVNNAGVTIYGNLLEVQPADMRQLFDTNFWGLVYGSVIAARHLRTHGGALLNIGSTLSDRAMPVQGIYSASKHAVKGFTDALRMELEHVNAPVSITLIKPSAIDTPYTQHARNYLGVKPQNPPPVYAPEVVARIILHCATHPEREVFAGGGGKLLSALGYFSPRMTDRTMERYFIRRQRTNEPAQPGPGFYEGGGRLEERGGYSGHVAETSLYSQVSMHPAMAALLAVGAGALLAALIGGSRKGKP